MDIQDCSNLTNGLMAQHGLFDKGWTFAYDRAKRRLGLCSYRKKTIFLSSYYVQLNDEGNVKDTILHEIAHALLDPDIGHGYLWRQKAIEIGASPNRTGKANHVEPRYDIVCPNHGIIGHMYRNKRKNLTFVCKSCKSPVTYENRAIEKSTISR